MPKQPRIIEKGKIYHVFNRGVEKRKIFMNDQDYSRFIIGLEFFNQKNPIDLWGFLTKNLKGKNVQKLLAEKLKEERAKKSKPIVEILVFCLMPNHFHLVIREIVEGGLSWFMNKMGGYSSYFNKQNKRVGPLFQSRFKCVLINNDQQLQAIFNYVHTNAVELIEHGWKEFRVKDYKKAIDFLNNYKWSSYRDYIEEPTNSLVTNRDFFNNLLDGSNGCRDAVEEWIKFKAQDIIGAGDEELESIFLN
ncbi:hypothetical protein A3A09_00670 [Candidatus Nomurabacteria bacterium RIFCSPLOWO2_01_FULL_42_20]|uniref:Transposase IS200-like domain-containing protein n=1 Tax=Candidatus Nomurabacteria bacterium RIFCSPHIGHO2_01_FULL_42_16 TaxID=1801743 RepID=A0A1F6VLG4_9BACT|nr:MAG: hypothetical protein A2824_02185 [Candidatus Nomurabacteria bacterium RIFCSPHIGHO2_01_FULL_42_16]OGI92281.1 MAG: hypothetical protein A3A09_00670 [Candidatus Nomurabacteria bacterium RIFCSPLOWO2_01_FULL_42_20]